MVLRFQAPLKAEKNSTHVFQVSRDEQDSVTPKKGNEGMDFKFKKLAWYVMPSVVALALAGCGSDNDSTTNPDNGGGDVKTAKFELLLKTGTEAAAAAASTKASAADFAKYNLYIWNDGECKNGIAAQSVTKGWNDVTIQPTNVSERGNPIWEIPVTADAGCFNMIVREDANGDKAVTDDEKRGGNRKMSITADNKDGMAWPTSDEIYPSYQGAVDGLTSLSGASAHLVAIDTLAWNKADSAKEVRLYHSATGGFKSNGTALPEGKFITLTPTDKNYDGDGSYMDSFKTFTIATADQNKLKDLVKEELVAVAVSSTDTVLATTQVQTAQLLDVLFAEKAKALEYGAIVSDDAVTFRLWAPTAQSVSVVTYNADKSIIATTPMTFDSDAGAWSYVGDTDLKGKFYRYEISVFHPLTRQVESYQVTDPYSLSLSMNSEYSQVVDLNDADLKPEGWDTLQAPHSQATPADVAKIVVHESHVRDLTAFDTEVPAAERGKFVALTEENSLAVKHLKELAAAGVTHLQILPAFDIATINEDPTQVANLDDKFSKLCAVNTNVASSKFKANCTGDSTVAEVMATLDKDGEDRQELNRMVADTDSFNWGYDPFHYTTPEGSYSTNPDGTARILEFRKMVKAIKENIGMNVVMDVVYNHTNESGLGKKSVLDKIVPWYYQRLNEISGSVETSTCCSNTAPEHAMFAKLMDDSLLTWTEEYKIDSFRFDIMGHHPKAQMVEALAKVKAVAPEMYFYGEGWNFGEIKNDVRFVQARQAHLAGTGIGSFSDRLRDAVRGGGPFDGKYDADGDKPAGNAIRDNQGFGNGAFVLPNESNAATEESARYWGEITMLGMAGNLKDFVLLNPSGVPQKGSDIRYGADPEKNDPGQDAGYAQDPTEIQNYVGKHDNQTLFDIIAYKAAKEADMATRVRMQGISLSTVMLGQGIVFDQQGSELLRSKSFERDSYDSGDWYNKVDYTKQDNNYDVGLPRKDKDGDNYPLIKAVKNVVGKPGAAEIAQMESFYKELASLRKSSPLFTLGTGAEVMKRVDFRNVGPEQITGLIAMTIDDGTGMTDLDSKLDGIVVLVNSTPDTQTIGDFKDGEGASIALSGYELSSIQTDLGSDSIGNGATFDNGQFSVPAWSVAVFVKPQGSVQGIGLPVSKKQDLSSIPPFGDTPIYVKGLFEQWGTEVPMTFSGDYTYTADIEVTAEDLAAHDNTLFKWGIKVADETFTDAVNYGKCTDDNSELTIGVSHKLCNKAKENVVFKAAEAGSYHVTFVAKDKTNPTLTVSFVSATATCKLLADSTETAPLGATKLALRGAHVKDWAWDAKYELTYKGNNIYQVQLDNVDLSGGFKIADSTWAVQFLAVTGSPAATQAKPADIAIDMQADTEYAAYGRLKDLQVPDGNNTASVTKTGSWVYQLKMNDSYNAADASTKGIISMCQM
jgi:pullulanase